MEECKYSYIDAKNGVPIERAVRFYLHGLKYEIAGDGCFFWSVGNYNDAIFKTLGYTDQNELFRQVLGDDFMPVPPGCHSSPYAKTEENARKVILKILETPKFKVGTIVRIKSDLHQGNDYGVYCNDDMPKFAGKEGEIIKTRIKDDGRFGYNILYTIKICGDIVNSQWTWTEDMFEDKPVKDSDEEQYISIPKIQPIKELQKESVKSESVNTHTSIQLPKHSKHLKITL